MAASLAGLTVVVTRPAAQGAPLAAALRAQGVNAIEFPVLEIIAVPAALPPGTIADAAIYVSANAVEHGLGIVRAANALPVGPLSGGAPSYAIGRATAAALKAAGVGVVVSPQQSIDSEGLLALPQLQMVQGQHIIVVKGRSAAGGRRLIEETLAARGARVTVLACYERIAATPSQRECETLVEVLKREHGAVVTAMSVETLDSLLSALGAASAALRGAWLLVPHERVAAAARARGFTHVALAPMAADGLIAALIALEKKLSE